jgi:3-hydroxymyristoyl/3-hydroxydecanoyl-(acyl carrier protein) dehydratase
VSVPASHPGFAGHFPGSPVLPGVVQIGLVLEALGEAGAAPPRVAGIPSVRFRAVVVPGDVLDVRATGPGPDGRVGFEIRRGETLVSHGALVVEAA